MHELPEGRSQLMQKGLMVRMIKCCEASKYPEVFETVSEPWTIGDGVTQLIKIKGTETGKYFSGFSVSCLEVCKK